MRKGTPKTDSFRHSFAIFSKPQIRNSETFFSKNKPLLAFDTPFGDIAHQGLKIIF